MCFVPNVFHFFSTSQLRVPKQAANANEPRFAELQWGRQAASLQVCRSGFWGMERPPKDNTIKFRSWFMPFLSAPWALLPFLPSSMEEMKLASSCWLHPQEQQDAGCTQDWTSCLVPPYPWAGLAPLTSQSCLCPCFLLFLVCQTLWFLVCGLKHALARVLITVHLSSSWLMASALPALILLFSP